MIEGFALCHSPDLLRANSHSLVNNMGYHPIPWLFNMLCASLWPNLAAVITSSIACRLLPRVE